jgi:hypothetical protein
MVTLAVTVVVPLTVEPDLGDVRVITRLPGRGGSGSGSCAKTRSGEIQITLEITAKTNLTEADRVLLLVGSSLVQRSLTKQI